MIGVQSRVSRDLPLIDTYNVSCYSSVLLSDQLYPTPIRVSSSNNCCDSFKEKITSYTYTSAFLAFDDDKMG